MKPDGPGVYTFLTMGILAPADPACFPRSPHPPSRQVLPSPTSPPSGCPFPLEYPRVPLPGLGQSLFHLPQLLLLLQCALVPSCRGWTPWSLTVTRRSCQDSRTSLHLPSEGPGCHGDCVGHRSQMGCVLSGQVPLLSLCHQMTPTPTCWGALEIH